jgi:hypothetical protein
MKDDTVERGDFRYGLDPQDRCFTRTLLNTPGAQPERLDPDEVPREVRQKLKPHASSKSS